MSHCIRCGGELPFAGAECPNCRIAFNDVVEDSAFIDDDDDDEEEFEPRPPRSRAAHWDKVLDQSPIFSGMDDGDKPKDDDPPVREPFLTDRPRPQREAANAWASEPAAPPSPAADVPQLPDDISEEFVSADESWADQDTPEPVTAPVGVCVVLPADKEAAETENEEEQAEAERAEAERVEAEHVEAERVEAERVEAERVEAERIEAERVEAEHVEAERVEAERVEAERVEAERIEAERVEAERVEAERVEAERVEAERVEAERVEAERVEAERVEAERVEAERIEAERVEAERVEAERVEAERVEAERVEAERVEAERVEAERIEAERVEAERVEAERIEAERVEAERIEAERVEAERIEAERVEAERVEAERVEAERVEAERVEAERVEAERVEAERVEAERVEAERIKPDEDVALEVADEWEEFLQSAEAAVERSEPVAIGPPEPPVVQPVAAAVTPVVEPTAAPVVQPVVAPVAFSDSTDDPSSDVHTGPTDIKITPHFEVHSAPANGSPVVHALLDIEPSGAPLVDGVDGPLAHVILALDLSASMNDARKYPVLTRAIEKMLGDLRRSTQGDVLISLVVFAYGAEILLRAQPASQLDPREVLGLIDRSPLRFSRYTDIVGALTRSGRIAYDSHRAMPRVPVRIHLLTDGKPQDVEGAQRQMALIRKIPVDVHGLGFGNDADLGTLQDLISGGRGGTVKHVCSETLSSAFERIAQVARRVVAKRALLDVELKGGAVGGASYRFRPARHAYGKQAFQNGQHFHTDLGTLESGRHYSLLFQLRLPATQSEETEIGRVTLRIPGVGGPVTFERLLFVARHPGDESPKPNEIVVEARHIVEAVGADDPKAQLKALRARRRLYLEERRDAYIIELIDRAIEQMETKGSLDAMSNGERAALQSHTRSVVGTGS